MNSTVLIFLVFIFFVVVIFGAGKIYSTFFDPNNRRIKKSVKEFKTLSKDASSQSSALLKDGDSDGQLIETLKKMDLAVINKLQLLIIRSGVDKSLQDILIFCLLSFVAGLFLCLLGNLSILLSLIVLAGFTLLPVFYLNQKQAKRIALFVRQFPDALDHISRSIKTGNGLITSIGLVASDLSEPVSDEFRQVFEEINYGIDFTQSLSNLATRVPSSDLNFFVIALLIQRESGGNLTELLGNLSATMRERVKLHGKIQTLSAEGRFSAYLLGVLPFIIGVLFYFLNPEYMSLLWQTSTGQNLLGVGLVLMVFGFFWLMNIVKIEV